MLNIAAIFKTGETHKILILREKQEGGFVLRMTNVVRGRTSTTYLGYSSYLSQITISWMTHYTQLNLAQNGSFFSQNGGDV